MLTYEEEQELISLFKLSNQDLEGSPSGWFFLNPKRFREVFINDIAAAIRKVHQYNNDLYIINFGREGSGKSLFSLWIGYELKKRGVLDFNWEKDVVFNHIEWLLAQNNSVKSYIVYDEAEETFDTQKFQTEEGRAGKRAAIRGRYRQNINVLTYPSLRYMHTYIREERSDLLLLNISVDLATTGRRIYIKALYDKRGLTKLLETMTKTTFMDKFKIFKKRSKDGKYKANFKPIIAGVFDISDLREDREWNRIVSFYDFRKEVNNKIDAFENFFKTFLEKGNLSTLLRYIHSTPPELLYTFKILGLLMNSVLPPYMFSFNSKSEKGPFKDYNVFIPFSVLYLYLPKYLVEEMSSLLNKSKLGRVEFVEEFGYNKFNEMGLLFNAKAKYSFSHLLNYDFHLPFIEKEKILYFNQLLITRFLFIDKISTYREAHDFINTLPKAFFRDLEKIMNDLLKERRINEPLLSNYTLPPFYKEERLLNLIEKHHLKVSDFIKRFIKGEEEEIGTEIKKEVKKTFV